MSHREIARFPGSMLRRIVTLILTIALASTGLAPFAFAEALTGQLQFAEGTYRINVGDVLSVNVYNQTDLSSSGILVRSDGNATFNGVGEMHVAGKTIREASQLIESQVQELVRDPRISLTVSESKPPSVYLAGAVMRPGMLQNLGGSSSSGTTSESGSSASNTSSGGGKANQMDFRLSNVLSASGGVKLNADLANIMISRNGEAFKTVNLWPMLRQGDTDADLMLQNGDSVYIPELPDQALDDATYKLLLTSAIGPKTFPVRVLGEIKTPGVYELNGNSPYLNSVIAKSGGYNSGANRKVVALRRFTAEDKFSTLNIDPSRHDFVLRPNDVIYISELQAFKTGRYSENVAKIMSPFTSLTSAFIGLSILGKVK
jgi:polysaccharide export outer membrane protein